MLARYMPSLCIIHDIYGSICPVHSRFFQHGTVRCLHHRFHTIIWRHCMVLCKYGTVPCKYSTVPYFDLQCSPVLDYGVKEPSGSLRPDAVPCECVDVWLMFQHGPACTFKAHNIPTARTGTPTLLPHILPTHTPITTGLHFTICLFCMCFLRCFHGLFNYPKDDDRWQNWKFRWKTAKKTGESCAGGNK